MLFTYVCLNTFFLNWSSEPWNDYDKKRYERSIYVCATDERYEETPCLKSFIKVEPRVYRSICGPKTMIRSIKVEVNESISRQMGSSILK